MTKGRSIGPWRMNAALRLIELLRVTEQHATRGGLRYREHIRKTHLASLINEQNVDRLVHFAPSPQPARPARNQCSTFPQGIEDGRIVVELFDEFVRAAIGFICFLHCSQRNTGLPSHLARFTEQMANHLVADCCNSGAPPGFYEFYDH